MARERNVEQFNRDVEHQGGYEYTDMNRLSSRLANHRISEAIFGFAQVRGRRVIDIGCGDGTYTIELAKAGAAEVLGVDAAEAAIERARKNAVGLDNVRFEVRDIYDLNAPEERYDVAVVRGILHHLYDAPAAVDRIMAVANAVIVVEPNGYNPVLKILEKVSPYHVAHEEKSYSPSRLNRWFEACGGEVTESTYIGLVPMFCPDALAKVLKRVEPLIENIPGLRRIACGQYVQKVTSA